MQAKACPATLAHRFNRFIALSVALPVALPIALVVALVFGNIACASNSELPPIGDMLRETELVITGDIKKAATNSSFTPVHVQRILKGKIPGGKGDLRVGPIMQIYELLAPAKNVTLLLRRVDWTSEYDWYPVMVYFEPRDIQAVQTLCALYTVRDERRRLLELFAMARREVPYMRKELLGDIRAMTDPAAFPVVFRIYFGLLADDLEYAASTKLTARDRERFKKEKHLSESHERAMQRKVEREFYRKEYLDTIASFGDKRVVPLLIQALSDDSWTVSVGAAEQLYKHYREAPEVQALLARGNVAMSRVNPYALFDYWVNAHDPYVEGLAVGHELAYATKLRFAGKHAEAREVYWRVVERRQNDLEASMAALALLEGATHAERDKIRLLVLPHATKRLAVTSFFGQEQVDVRLLRKLGDPSSLNVLTNLIRVRTLAYSPTAYDASMAINELGPQARKQVVTQIFAWLSTDDYNALYSYVNVLLWLGTAQDIDRAAAMLPKKPTQVWLKLKSEKPRLSSQDELQFLIDKLGLKTLPNDGDWTIRRLGELGDERAVEPLVKLLVGMSLWSPAVYGTDAVEDALTRISGKQVEAQMISLLGKTGGQKVATEFAIPEDRLKWWRGVDPNQRLKWRATRVLLHVQGAAGVSTAREIIAGTTPGSKEEAIRHLGWFGTKEDSALLQPFRDYWHGDRELHGVAMTSSALLRARLSDEWLVDPDVVHRISQPVEVRSHRCFPPELPCY